MSGRREEQESEIEVLRSIYPDELRIVAENEIEILIALDEETAGGKVLLTLGIFYPEDYPDVQPELLLQWEQDAQEGLQEEDEIVLLDRLNESAEANLGMAMVFTLTSLLKDASEELIVHRKEARLNGIAADEQARQAEEDARRAESTPVTAATFAKWWQESGKSRMMMHNQHLKSTGDGKPTGREIFLSRKGLVEAQEEDEAEEDVDLENLRLE